MKPRIGVTTAPLFHEDRFLESIERAFVRAVIRAGGTPFLLPVLDASDAPEVLSCLDGLLLTGGGDIHPSRYGQPARPEVKGVDPGRDAYELALAEAGWTRGLPMLGVCRGAQVLNVALGGDLEQHLPARAGTDPSPDGRLDHCQKDRFAEVVHDVAVRRRSRLAGIVGSGRLGVNSLHHQAAASVAPGLRVSARATDGTVEAIESEPGSGAGPVLGVQWHPELLDGAEHLALFAWLVEESTVAVPTLDPVAPVAPLPPTPTSPATGPSRPATEPVTSHALA